MGISYCRSGFQAREPSLLHRAAAKPWSPFQRPASSHLHCLHCAARRLRIVVGKWARWILSPRPHMQLVERLQAVAIWGAIEVEQMTVQRSRTFERYVFNRNQFQTAIRLWLVHHRLRASDVDGRVFHIGGIDIVDAHRAAILASGAFLWDVSFFAL